MGTQDRGEKQAFLDAPGPLGLLWQAAEALVLQLTPTWEGQGPSHFHTDGLCFMLHAGVTSSSLAVGPTPTLKSPLSTPPLLQGL